MTEYVWEYYKDKLNRCIPAIGTHFPMTEEEIRLMYGKIPNRSFPRAMTGKMDCFDAWY